MRRERRECRVEYYDRGRVELYGISEGRCWMGRWRIEK